MTRTVGMGVIGMGWMGSVHSRAYRMVADRFHNAGIAARLVVCADEFEARATGAKNRFGFERSTTDWREVLDDPAVEAVNICAPNGMHLEIAQAAAAAGKHIFCEKPVGRDPQETAQIVRAARDAGVITGVGYNYRWAPVVQFARQLIQEGKLGEITHYRGRFLVDYGSNPNGVLSWRFERNLAGLGTLGDLMSHVVDMAHMLTGPLERVVASQQTFIKERPTQQPGTGNHYSVGESGQKSPVTNEDYVGALAQFQNGAMGTFEVCRIAKGASCEHTFELNGTRGFIKWNFERMNEIQVFIPDDTAEHDGPALIPCGPQLPFYANFYPGPANSMSYEDLKLIEAFHFLQSVATGEQGEPSFADTLAVAQVQAAMQRSWETGTWETVREIAVRDS